MRRLTPLLCCVCVVSLWASPRHSGAVDVTRLRYEGQLVQRDANGTGVPVRSFNLHAWVAVGESGPRVIYRVDDDAARGLAWYERLGETGTDAESEGRHPHLKHLHLNRPYFIRLAGPFVQSPEPLTEDATWDATWDGRRVRYEVTGAKRVANRECWEVEASNDIGRWQTLSVDQEAGYIVAANLKVFLGQGDRFDLQLRLQEQEALAAADGAAELSAADALLNLQQRLGAPADGAEVSWTAERLAEVEAGLPAALAAAAGTTWDRFAKGVASDLATEQHRARSVADLAKRRVGQPAPEHQLIGIDGQPLAAPADKPKVTILHFWDYRGTPESPFGQVGYLDFLATRRKGDGVQVYGVAVDERLADAAQSASARRDVRAFSTQFIRLGYPIAMDDGHLLQKFGDPRQLEAPLPLWVVIGPDGKIAHFRTGLYPLDPSRGLTELDALVTELLRQ